MFLIPKYNEIIIDEWGYIRSLSDGTSKKKRKFLGTRWPITRHVLCFLSVIKRHHFPTNIVLWWKFVAILMAALEEIQAALESSSRTRGQNSDTVFHCFSAHDAFLDGRARPPPSNSIRQRVIFQKKHLAPTSSGAKLASLDVPLGGWGVCVMVANRTHWQGQSAALRTCRMCKSLGARRGPRPLVHFSVFPEGVSRSSAVGAWGTAGDSGWKGVFQMDALHGCFWEAVMKTRGG